MEQQVVSHEITSNRIAKELSEWKAREQRFEKLFSADILKDSAFLKEKLGFYEHLQAKYSRTNAPEEKMTLIILARQQDLLRKQVYPNLWLRLLQRVLAPFNERQQSNQRTHASDRNLGELKEAVIKAGFESVNSKLAHYIKQGQREFSLPLSYYISENQKMDINLSFTKDASGDYRFEKYQASLIHNDNPNESKKQIFSTDDQINSLQAQNLLSGRAVKIETFDIHNGSNSKWIQLDFNDQDPSGNHKLKEFHKDYGFDLQKTVALLDLKENKSAQAQQLLLDALSRGERRQVTMIREGEEVKLFVEANPQFKILNVYDDAGKKVSMGQASAGMKNQSLKVTEQTAEESENKSRRNGQHVRA